MADQIPCPNPACSHTFTLAELQAAAQVRCPRCGFRMQGRGPAMPAAPPAPAAPAAKPAAKAAAPQATATQVKRAAVPPKAAVARPVARPTPSASPGGVDVDLVEEPAAPPLVPPAAPVAPLVAPPVTPPVGATSGPIAPAPPRGDALRFVTRLLVIVAVVGFSFCVVSTASVFMLVKLEFFTLEDLRSGQVSLEGPKRSDRQTFWGNARNVKGGEEKAFKLLLAKNAWTPDKELKTNLGALGAWRHRQDDVWLAVAVKDYDTQKPRDAELLQQAIERLEQEFGDSLELAAKSEPTDFAGVPSQRLTFRGQTGAVVWSGECLMFTQHGFGYWVFLAGPSLDEVRPYELELGKEDTGFSFAADRKGWREQPPKMQTFTSTDGRLAVTAPEGVWEKSPSATVEFDTGTLLLLGRFLKEKDNQKNAHLQAFTLDREPDLKAAATQARDYLAKQKKDQNSGYKLEPTGEGGVGADVGSVEDVGNRKGRILELKLSLNDTSARYYLMAVVSESDAVVVVLFDCTWKSRQIWRQDFLELVKAMKVRAKAA